MRKFFLILLCCVPVVMAIAASQDEALKSRDEAIQALRKFNPKSVLKGYTENPKESSLQPREGANALSYQGLNALGKSEIANQVYIQAGQRAKVHANPMSHEMQYAEKLLENSDDVLDGACYRKARECKNKSVIKTCEESVQYAESSCKETLSVRVLPITKNFSRVVPPSRFQSTATINLQSCLARDSKCKSVNTMLIAPNCEHLSVIVKRKNQQVLVTKQPTCADPSITVQLLRRHSVPLQITVTEYVSEDQWKGNDCDRIRAANGQCFLEGSQVCLEPNQSKVVSGLAIKRPCWGRAYHYQCATVNSSSCASLINRGCSQTASSCIQTLSNRCERFSQTFQCMEKICFPEKIICPTKIACSDGKCDTSKIEASGDMAEGLSRLGALAGVSGDVAANQVRSGSPAIFIGSSIECKKYPIGFRDCCTDSGWGDWVKNCPADLQVLQRAKQENRVVYLGDYKNHKLGSHHHTYCVFPTKLAGIVQIQGRGKQLGIPYGTAKYPNCRGLTPEELQHINFTALDLSPIEQELISRMALPNNGSINKINQSHIELLKQKGRAHD